MKFKYIALVLLVSPVLSSNLTYAFDEATHRSGKVSKYQKPDRSLWQNILQEEDNLPKDMKAVPERHRSTTSRKASTVPVQQAIPAQ